MVYKLMFTRAFLRVMVTELAGRDSWTTLPEGTGATLGRGRTAVFVRTATQVHMASGTAVLPEHGLCSPPD